MNPILRDFLPFLLMGGGGVIMALGGFDGSTFDPRNAVQMIGAILAAVGTAWTLWRIIRMFVLWVINWIHGR